MTFLHSTRALAADRKQCAVCFEEFFDIPERHEPVLPVRMACGHIFCKSCIETHRSFEIKCPFPWCKLQLPLQPEDCELCAYWVRNQADSLVLTVRANEMTESIREALEELAEEHDIFELSKSTKRSFLSHIRRTLTRFEWQYHQACDLAELLDPFLTTIDPDEARKFLDDRLSEPAPDVSLFPPREHDPDDYPAGKEPWIAAFLRQWASEYVQQNGEVQEGWGVWGRKLQRDGDWSWEWPYKHILGHRYEDDGTVSYLVKWVGKRFEDSWVKREQMSDGASNDYDKRNGV
jgi:hypothetical protein